MTVQEVVVVVRHRVLSSLGYCGRARARIRFGVMFVRVVGDKRFGCFVKTDG